MKDFLKRYYKELILIFFYIAIACAAYICGFDSMWHLWYVDLVTGLAILALGVTVGFIYISSLEKENKKKEEKVTEEANKEDNNLEA